MLDSEFTNSASTEKRRQVQSNEMKMHYLLSMLSLSVAHMALALTFMMVTGRFDRLAVAIPVNLIWLVGINVVGAYFIFRPIGRFLDSGEGRDVALGRVRNLITLSVVWGITLVLPLTVFALFVVEVFCSACDDPNLTPWLLTQVAIFTVFCGAYLFFLISDFVSRLRIYLFHQFDIVLKPTGGRLIYKLLVAFISIGIIPLTLAFLNVLLPGEFHPSSSISSRETALFYLLISALMSVTAFFYIQRYLRRPIEELRKSIHDVATGHFDDKSPVMTDDELGVIAQDFNLMTDGLKERQKIREAFGRYIPEEMAKAILENEGVLQPQREEATILFTDIKGFTAICESLAPEDVVIMLNEYFTTLVKNIRRHQGTVTQFQGDAILAVFNVPIRNPAHAANAVRAAMKIQRALSEKKFPGNVMLPTRVGINTGTVVSGSVGEGHRLSYTVHGDAVNLAARLEQLNKELRTSVLVSMETRDAAGSDFDFKSLGEFHIRGKAEPVAVYEPLAQT